MLFDSENFKLSEPKAMNPSERQKKVKEQLSLGLILQITFMKILNSIFIKERLSIPITIMLPLNFIKPLKDIM